MRKRNYLAIVLVVAIMMMGAGYAYWTQEVKIATTVETGNLDVKLQATRHVQFGVDYLGVGLKGGNIDAAGTWVSKETHYVDGKDIVENRGISVELLQGSGMEDMDHTFTMNVTNMYPGSQVRYHLNVKNESTMPIKISEAWIKEWNEKNNKVQSGVRINMACDLKKVLEPGGNETLMIQVDMPYTEYKNEMKGNQKDESNIVNGEPASDPSDVITLILDPVFYQFNDPISQD